VATFENTVLIARPIEDVFAFLSDLENVRYDLKLWIGSGDVSAAYLPG
jgi:uncharacterized protein YndB with AHSA1/START domain